LAPRKKYLQHAGFVFAGRFAPFSPGRRITVELDSQGLARPAFCDQGVEQGPVRKRLPHRGQERSAPTGFVEALKISLSTARRERPARESRAGRHRFRNSASLLDSA